MSRAISPLPQYAFMAWCLDKAQGQLYIYLYLTWPKVTRIIQNMGIFLKVEKLTQS